MTAPSAANSDRPHVLVLMTDQLRWDCLGFAGNADVKTPHLDRLARDGTWFPTTFCPLPVCTPSRYSLLSGLYVHQHGGWSNRCTLTPDIETFPRVLRRAGYRTHAAGKMHLTPTYLDVGFDALQLAEQNGQGRYDDDYHRELMAAGLVPSIDLIDQEREWRQGAPESYWETFGAERSNLPEAWHSTTWIGDRAVQAIERWEEEPERPQLLMASFVKPHHPFDPPAPWDEMYDAERLTILPGWTEAPPARDVAYSAGHFPHERLTERALRRVMAYYYATITQIDHQVGRMIGALERRGLYERTMIVFTADHGEYLGFHHLLLKGGQMYEPLARVPLVMKLANTTRGTQAGVRRDVLASTVDVAPTILRACGVEPSGEMRGLNLADTEAERDCAFAEIRRGPAYMARTRRHKLLLNREDEHSQLFDLEVDPYEERNVIESEVTVRAELEARLGRWLLFESPTPVRLDERAPVILGPNVPSGAEHREALRAYLRREMSRVGRGA